LSCTKFFIDTIDKYLKPLQASERADIIREIKSEMLELEAQEHLTPQQITDRLGDAKTLAKA
jgi:uncharacterized membrane protein